MEKKSVLIANLELIDELKKINPYIGAMSGTGDYHGSDYIDIGEGAFVVLNETFINPNSGNVYYLVKNYWNEKLEYPAVSYQSLSFVLSYVKAGMKVNSTAYEPVNKSEENSRSTGTNKVKED